MGNRFGVQLRELIAELDTTGLHFVRCIKPNAALKPDSFEAPMTLHQLRWGAVQMDGCSPVFILPKSLPSPRPPVPCALLPDRCCGVLEVARIARAGFPTRYTHAQFADRYAILLPGEEQQALLKGGSEGARKVGGEVEGRG